MSDNANDKSPQLSDLIRSRTNLNDQEALLLDRIAGEIFHWHADLDYFRGEDRPLEEVGLSAGTIVSKTTLSGAQLLESLAVLVKQGYLIVNEVPNFPIIIQVKDESSRIAWSLGPDTIEFNRIYWEQYTKWCDEHPPKASSIISTGPPLF
jgi:hypothetical protein